jgi:hypothetical protein
MPPVKKYCATCPPHFVIVVGDPGVGRHNTGGLFEIAAHHHIEEIKNNKFPGLPHFDKDKDRIVGPIRINRAINGAKGLKGLNQVLGDYNNIKYLAYFGHSWTCEFDVIEVYRTRIYHTDGTTILYYGDIVPHASSYLAIGDDDATDTNLGSSRARSASADPNNTPVSALTNAYNINPVAQIRLFGCRGGHDKEMSVTPQTLDRVNARIISGTPTKVRAKTVAEQFAEILPSGVSIYAFDNKGGSAFTFDEDVGHLTKQYQGRAYRRLADGSLVDDEVLEDERKAKRVRKGGKTAIWLVSNTSAVGMKKWNGKR